MGASAPVHDTGPMSETPPTDEPSETSPPPPPPPGAAAIEDDDTFRGLRRSRSDRVVAGVAGGLGQYFGIDPVIVRIAFIVLTVFSGTGFLLYLLGWIVIAKDGDHESSAMRALRGSPDGNRGLLFVVLAVGAILVISSPFIWWEGFGIGDGLALPLLLIAAGVAFLVWPADRGWHDRSTHRVGPTADQPGDGEDPPPPSPGTQVKLGLQSAADEIRAARDEVHSELTEARASFDRQRRNRGWRHGYRHADGPRHRTYVREPRPPSPAPFIGPLTMATLLVFAGVSILGERAEWWNLEPAVYGGIVLAIIGAALVVSAFFGRARGLIFAGMLVLPVAWFLAAIDLEWHDGAGERVDRPASIDDLQLAYEFGFGDYEVDLSDVDFGGEDRVVDVSLTMGELTVWVPDTVTVEVSADARAGEIKLVQRDGLTASDDGFPAEAEAVFTGSGDGHLTLDVGVGFGAVDVRSCTNVPEAEGVRCP